MTHTTSLLNVVIAEDHDLLRKGLCAAFRQNLRFCIVGEAADGLEALHLVHSEKPDIVLMDIDMPVMNGIEATQKIKKESAGTKVLMLTSQADREKVFASLAAGADGYCMKDIDADNLFAVMDMIAEGAAWLDPGIARMVLSALPGGEAAPEEQKPPSEKSLALKAHLTDREIDVLTCIVEGKTNRQIAEGLMISPSTVKTHIHHIIEKLAVGSRTQAAVFALQEGLISE